MKHTTKIKKESAAEIAYRELLDKEAAAFDAVVKRFPQHSKILQLKVPLNDDYTAFTYGYIKYPAREDVSIAMTMKDTDPLRGKEIVLRNNWLEGDTQLLDDTELFLSTCTVLDEVLSIRQAIVKKNYRTGQLTS